MHIKAAMWYETIQGNLFYANSFQGKIYNTHVKYVFTFFFGLVKTYYNIQIQHNLFFNIT